MASPTAAWIILSIAAGFILPVLSASEEYCIAGTVVNAVTGEPLRRAAVTIPQSATLTDAAGAFRFCQLAAGSYHMSVEKPGYAPREPIIFIGPSRQDLVLRVTPLGRIEGKVTDDNGEALDHVQVQLLTIAVVRGRRIVQVGSTVSTDDRGLYRFTDLGAPRYFVKAVGWDSPRDSSSNEAFSPIYYGGAATIETADPVILEPGADLRADFSLSLHPGYKIQGAIRGLVPSEPAKIELLGEDLEPGGAPATVDTVTGAFEVESVPQGSYTLRVTQGEGNASSRGELPLTVQADVKGAMVTLLPGMPLTGVVHAAPAADGQSAAPPNCVIELAPEAWSTWRFGASTEPDGGFHIDHLLPGRYRVYMDCANGYVSEAHMGKIDIAASGKFTLPAGTFPQPIEAVLASDGGTVTVKASDDRESPSGWALLYPSAGNDFYSKIAHIDKGGMSFPNIAPGDYQIFAWRSLTAFEYSKPEVRQAWAGRAVSVHVDQNSQQTVSVKIEAGDEP